MKLNNVELYPQEYLAFIEVFHTSRDYFQCHDLLEELWRDVSLQLDKSHVYVGLLQIAVAMYHWRRENWRGAQLLIEGSIEKLQVKRDELEQLGIEFHPCLALLHQLATDIEQQKHYYSPNLPLTSQLTRLMQMRCEQTGMCWQGASDLSNELLVHRHLYK
ncbi:MAG: DUF309 domain-containing protein [Culicoidibacterales bacterium]